VGQDRPGPRQHALRLTVPLGSRQMACASCSAGPRQRLGGCGSGAHRSISRRSVRRTAEARARGASSQRTTAQDSASEP
jgi:hypothetical protein